MAKVKTTDSTDSIVKMLGKEADYLLNHKSKTVSKNQLHLDYDGIAIALIIIERKEESNDPCSRPRHQAAAQGPGKTFSPRLQATHQPACHAHDLQGLAVLIFLCPGFH